MRIRRALLGAVAATAASMLHAEAANVLLNPDFEVNGVSGQMSSSFTNIAHWIIFGSGSSGWYQDDIEAGNMCIKFWWDDIGIYQDFDAEAGQQFEFRVYALQRDSEPLVDWQGYLKAEFYDSGDGQLLAQELDYFYPSDPTNQWVLLHGRVTAPSNTDYGRIVLGIKNWTENVSGAAYFDNASVDAVPEPAAVSLFALGLMAARSLRKRSA